MSRMLSVMSLLVVAGSASAVMIQPGDIVFIEKVTNNDSKIKFLDYSALATYEVLDAPGKRLSAMEIDTNGNFYAVNANTPLVVNASSLYRFGYASLLGPLVGNPQTNFSDVVVSGVSDLRAPGEAVFDPATNQLIFPNNNQNLQSTPDERQAIIGVNVTTGVVSTLAQDPTGNGGNFLNTPNFRQPNGITTDPTGVGNYLFVSPDGSDFLVPSIVPGGGGPQGGTLWRLNGETSGSGATLVKDLASPDIVSAVGRGLGFQLSMEPIPGENALLLTDAGDGDGTDAGIYRIDFNPDGSFASIALILSEANFPAMAVPGDIVYNPFTGKFVVGSQSLGANIGDFIFEMNADGTGVNILASNVQAGDFIIVTNNIPAPGAAALLGLAGVAGLRRRRA